MRRRHVAAIIVMFLLDPAPAPAVELPERPAKPDDLTQEQWEQCWMTYSQLHRCMEQAPVIKPQANGVLYMSVASAGIVRRKGAKGADQVDGRPLRNLKVDVWRHPRIRADDEELILDAKSLPVKDGNIEPGTWDMAVVMPCWRIDVPKAGRYLLVVTHATEEGRNVTVEILTYSPRGKQCLRQPISDATGESWGDAVQHYQPYVLGEMAFEAGEQYLVYKPVAWGHPKWQPGLRDIRAIPLQALDVYDKFHTPAQRILRQCGILRDPEVKALKAETGLVNVRFVSLLEEKLHQASEAGTGLTGDQVETARQYLAAWRALADAMTNEYPKVAFER